MEDRPPRIRRFARDVAVNVLAGLIASAAIYLFTVLIDALRADPPRVGVGSFVLLEAIALLLLAGAVYSGYRRSTLTSLRFAGAAAISTGLAVFVGVAVGATAEEPIGWGNVAGGLVSVGISAFFVILGVRLLRSARRR
jgi:hypothetical protein